MSCCSVLTIRTTIIRSRNRHEQLACLCLCNPQRNRGEQTSDQVILLGFKHWRYFLVAPVTSWNLLVIMRLPDNLQACVWTARFVTIRVIKKEKGDFSHELNVVLSCYLWMVEGKCNAVKKNMGSYFENSAGLFYRAPASTPNASFYANQLRSCTWSGCDAKTVIILSEIRLLCPFIWCYQTLLRPWSFTGGSVLSVSYQAYEQTVEKRSFCWFIPETLAPLESTSASALHEEANRQLFLGLVNSSEGEQLLVRKS